MARDSHEHSNVQYPRPSKQRNDDNYSSNQPTYATDINIIKETKGDVKNQP